MKPLILILAISVLPLAGCLGQPAASGASNESQTAAADPGAGAQGQPATAVPRTITGRVVETMEAASYTYVRVDTGSEQIWAAASQFPVKVGDRVRVSLEFPMENFHSKTLNRDFPVIYFVAQIAREGEAAASADGVQLPPGHAPVASHQSGAVAPPSAGEIKPADGGLTVADVWAKRTALAGKEVTVRGKVMKVNTGIMGRNWIHLQDGSGVASEGTNDLTLTSDGVARVGDIITATGTVAVDKDFTAGYKYAVLLEGVKIAAK